MSKAINIKDALTPSLLKEVISNELLKEIMTDAVVARGSVTKDDNVNEITTPGVYTVASDSQIQGLPSGTSMYGNLTVERGGLYIFQIYRTVDANVYQRRRYVGEPWNTWYKLVSGTPVT